MAEYDRAYACMSERSDKRWPLEGNKRVHHALLSFIQLPLFIHLPNPSGWVRVRVVEIPKNYKNTKIQERTNKKSEEFFWTPKPLGLELTGELLAPVCESTKY